MKKNYSGVLFIFLLPIISLVLLFNSKGLNLAPKNVNEFMLLLGKIFGILGMSTFAISIILSARLPILDKIFNGLNVVYLRHSQIGQISFILMLFHPILLLSNYTDMTFEGALHFIFISSDWNLNFGILALFLMILLIVLTLYFQIKYNVWKWTHKFMGLAFFLASLHVFLIPSDISRYLPLRIYMLVLSGVAIGFYLYRSILHKYAVEKYTYEVSEVKKVGSSITEIILKPTDKKLLFTAGQFIFISFLDKNIGLESHPFSITAGNDKEDLSITIKDLGDYTKNIDKVLVGTKALVEGPFGRFSYKDSIYKKQIWIAGGIGITPFLSMARSIESKDGYEIDLYYCVKNESESIYLTELSNYQNKGIQVIPFYSEKEGFINVEKIKEISGSLPDKSIFICSPVSMIQALRAQFIRNGISKSVIHSEEFSL